MISIQKSLELQHPDIQLPDYDPSEIKAGIAHIGVGNFHRAHQAYYTHQFLNNSNEKNWGIIGISITNSGPAMAEKFEKQDHLYTLTEFAQDGAKDISVVGAIVDYFPAKNQEKEALQILADEDIKIVSLTITEGGYYVDDHGNFDIANENIQYDLQHPEAPQTAFGYIVYALALRKQNQIPAFTVLSCDNVQHNGDVTKKAVLSFAQAVDKNLAKWIEENASFPNSMVDRITPSIDKEDKAQLNDASGIEDAIPVYAEKFTQWVIEDNFSMGRPDWEIAGATFVDDVTPYETLKLRFLNASHSMLAYPAALMGYTHVDKAMKDPYLKKYLIDFMNKDISPIVEVPENVQLKSYKQSLIERFSNPAVSDQLARLCYHGGAKIPGFILPSLKEILSRGSETKRISFLLAAYGHYLKEKEDNLGNEIVPETPKLSETDWQLIHQNDDVAFLQISPFKDFALTENEAFVQEYLSFRKQLRNTDLKNILINLNV